MSANIAIACIAERAIDRRLASEKPLHRRTARAASIMMKPIRPSAWVGAADQRYASVNTIVDPIAAEKSRLAERIVRTFTNWLTSADLLWRFFLFQRLIRLRVSDNFFCIVVFQS